MRKKHREKLSTALLILFLAISLILAGITGYGLWKNDREYAVGDELYDDVRRSVSAAQESEAPQEEEEDKPEVLVRLVEIPKMEIDWDSLKQINDDAAAWLWCPDTAIDYPVVMAEDYSYYLNHLIDGTYNLNGTLFLDYNCSPDFSDRLSVIYGHHMQSGSMFASLVSYKTQEYFDEHRYMYLYTEQGNYRVDLLCGCVVDALEWQDGAYVYQENLDSLLKNALKNTTFESGVTYTEQDNFIALSTCSYEFYDARYVVIGVLRPEFGTVTAK